MRKIILSFLITIFSFGCVSNIPKDQEECKDEAAKSARFKEAMIVQISLCEIYFPATRKINGGYEWRGHDVSGPNPTKEEFERIGEKYPYIRNVEGVGFIEFPSYMSDDAIEAAEYNIRKNNNDSNL